MKKRRRIRIITGSILAAVTFFITLNCSIVMLRRIKRVANPHIYKKNFLADLMLLSTLFITSLDLIFDFFTRTKNTFLKVLGIITRILFAIPSAAVLFFFGKTVIGGMIKTKKSAGYAVVLGMALENGKPTKDLLYRIQTAEEYLAKNPEGMLILTGGVPDANGRTEAQVMQKLLKERGISDEKMILEDKSESTKTNLKNTLTIVDPKEPVVLITNNYHMNRAVKAAKKAGFENVHRNPAPSSFFPFPSNVMWEVLHCFNEYTHIVKDV